MGRILHPALTLVVAAAPVAVAVAAPVPGKTKTTPKTAEALTTPAPPSPPAAPKAGMKRPLESDRGAVKRDRTHVQVWGPSHSGSQDTRMERKLGCSSVANFQVITGCGKEMSHSVTGSPEATRRLLKSWLVLGKRNAGSFRHI